VHSGNKTWIDHYDPYVVISVITLIAGCFSEFYKILWKRGNFATTGKFCGSAQIPWPAENCGAVGPSDDLGKLTFDL